MSNNNKNNSGPSSNSSPAITQNSNGTSVSGGTFTISAGNGIIFSSTPIRWDFSSGDTLIVQEEEKKHPKAKKIKMPDGSEAMECIKCSETCQWAEPNQDNGTFKCYICRTVM